MDQKEKDKGVVFVLLDRFNKQRLPRIKQLKKKVDSGVLLDKYDQRFIEEVQRDIRKVTPIIDRNPEYQELTAEALSLWTEIIEKNFENQNKKDEA